MTELLERALNTVRALSADMQDEIARMVLAYAGGEGQPVELTPDEKADLDASDVEVAQGDFATEHQLRSLWTKHGA